MRALLLAVAIALSGVAQAQATGPKSHAPASGTPTPRYDGPFGSDWAKPFPQTGGYMYNDPRTQGSSQPTRPYLQGRCPRSFDPATGRCR